MGQIDGYNPYSLTTYQPDSRTSNKGSETSNWTDSLYRLNELYINCLDNTSVDLRNFNESKIDNAISECDEKIRQLKQQMEIESAARSSSNNLCRRVTAIVTSFTSLTAVFLLTIASKHDI